MRIVAPAIIPLLFCTVGAVARSQPATAAIGRIWTEYRTAASFERIRDYFRGEDDLQSEHVFRTRPDSRDGYYFLVRIENASAPISDAVFEISVIMPGTVVPRAFPFRADIPEGDTAMNLGITGADWPGEGVRPLAWQVRLIRPTGGSGTIIAESQSFLWSKPAAAPATE